MNLLGRIYAVILGVLMTIVIQEIFVQGITTQCTNAQFQCQSGHCIPSQWRCDEEFDCEDKSDEEGCPPHTCSQTDFMCNNTKCIPKRWQCDDDDDCGDNSDEDKHLCDARVCPKSQFSCGQGLACIPEAWRCDEQKDCTNGADEEGCAISSCSNDELQCDNGKCITARWLCDQDNDCGDGSDEKPSECPDQTCASTDFRCTNSSRCIPNLWVCDGDYDCADKSDEMSERANCSTKPAACSSKEFVCANHDCIHQSWRCDGDIDCVDGSDETNCTEQTCAANQFSCASSGGRCIPGTWQCNGIQNCEDGSDEENCELPQASCDPILEFDCLGDGSMCIKLEKVCDQEVDCPEQQDESVCHAGSVINHCAESNGGCMHNCSNTPSKAVCSCRTGYELSREDGKTCKDINECLIPGKCSQYCNNTKGGYKCSCMEGYSLDPEDHRCKADGEEPLLLFANRHDLRQFGLETRKYREIIAGLSSAIAVDYDYGRDLVFWSDVTLEQILVTPRSGMNGSAYEQLVEKTNTADGIAFDWIHQNLYWTDTGANTIEVINYGHRFRKVLIDDNLDEPRALAVDPRADQGWMYWSDWGTNACIERAGLDGTHRKAIVTTGISWPNGLTIDYTSNRIFWIDAKLHQIESSDFNGLNRHLVLYSFTHMKHPFAVTVFEDNVYWTDWDTESIHMANKFNGSNLRNVDMQLYSPMDIEVYHRLRQPTGTSRCENSVCSHLCLPAPQLNSTASSAKYTCACPNELTLNEDGSTCSQLEPSEPIGPDLVTLNARQGVSPPESPHNTNTSNTKVGRVAAIVVGVLFAILILLIVIFVIFRSYTKRNKQSMNFDNPVYRKTTEDQFSLEKNQYQPSRPLPSTLEPLTTPSNEVV